jgi:Ni,Fe-hydrogenase I large subunit
LLDELLAERPSRNRCEVALMPAAEPGVLRSIVVPAMASDADFARAPTWNGRPIETGVLARTHRQPLVAAMARHCSHPVAVRLVARMVELASRLKGLHEWPQGTAAGRLVQGIAVARGEGLGAVQTARGLLLHRARVAGDRVADYQIVAPTEWNFHPQGPAVEALMNLPADDADSLERRAAATVQAFDPCVAYGIEIGHA